MYRPTDTENALQGQTNRRKNPVLMRFSRDLNVFHEKMTFGHRFGRACCIHPHIVGNSPKWMRVLRDEMQQRFNTHSGRFETLKVMPQAFF